MKSKFITLILTFFLFTLSVLANERTLSSDNGKKVSDVILLNSPDGKLKVQIDFGEFIEYSVVYDGEQVIAPSSLYMAIEGGKILGRHPKLKKIVRRHINEKIKTVAYRKSEVLNVCNELVLKLKDGYNVEFRAYDNGVAYRFQLSLGNKDFIVEEELCEYNFIDDYPSYYAYLNGVGPIEKQLFNSFENTYHHTPLTEIANDTIMFLPVMVELPNNIKACITEVNLFDYPGMSVQNFGSQRSLTSFFAHYPKRMEQGGHNNLQMLVKEREPFIAKINGNRTMPWRAMAISGNDIEMADNDLVFCLAEECRLTDTSWIKPGKVAWEWWHDWNLSGVDFVAGINNDTYKYYIDFASKFGLEHVILDEGWAVNGKADMLEVIPEINIKELVDYAASRNVGIILWGGYKAMDKDMERVCKHYSDMGVKGFKVDFMDRDDQLMVDFYIRMARMAAKYKMMIDFHGAFKPTGLNRTYPNVINYEGVHGMEQMKWRTNATDQMEYDVTLPYIRQFVGPMDYTQGAMRNAVRSNFYPCYSEPMSQGTRCHQLALYIVFESPLNMLCDSPVAYEKEPAYTKFISDIPTIWDETKVMQGKVGEYIVTARRKGNTWYVGGVTNWNERTVDVDLSAILNADDFIAEAYMDGVNASRIATDYKNVKDIKLNNGKLSIKMHQGGGFVLKLSKR